MRIINEMGICPICHSHVLEYGAIEMEDDGMFYYPWICDDCKSEGAEWYRSDFAGHNLITEDDEYELDQISKEDIIKIQKAKGVYKYESNRNT